MQTRPWRIMLAAILLTMICGSALAGTSIWSGTGPFAPAAGHRVVYALAISSDGSVIYSGLDTGTVMSLTFEPVIPPGTGYSIGASADSGSDDGSAPVVTVVPAGGSTVSVNVGGSTSVTGVIVTGTGNGGIVVTATATAGPGAEISPPPGGSVYAYLDITPAHYGTITGATITFMVSQSWLFGHNLAPQDVVMYHYTAGQWVALPTVVEKTGNGQVYFSATTTTLSPFAIGVRQNASVASTPTGEKSFGELAGTVSPSQAPATKPPAAHAPAASATTASPAPVAAEPVFPVMTIALIGAGCVVLVAGGWWVRRWWIRRQNPALFEEY